MSQDTTAVMVTNTTIETILVMRVVTVEVTVEEDIKTQRYPHFVVCSLYTHFIFSLVALLDG